MNKNDAKALMEKYLSGQATHEEKVLFERLYNKVLKERLQTGKQLDYPALKAALDKKLPDPNRRSVIRRFAPYGMAASIALCMIAAVAVYKFTQNQPTIEYTQNDIAPGGNKATLILADGRTITLSEAQSAIVVHGQRITYPDSAAEIVNLSAETANELILHTPKGGQYQITLPDGTKVWLNAASTLKYPSRFSGAERRVELSGEAYFEVASVPARSKFIVTTANQEVTVLGTHFNISAYNNEENTKTTLLEGSVQVTSRHSTKESATTILKPNQQSTITAGSDKIVVKTVNTGDYTAWKDNLLIFDQKSLKSILLTLSRWYDFQVDNTQIPDVSLSGAIPTDVKLSEVLTLLEETSQVKLKIESIGKKGERRIIIKK